MWLLLCRWARRAELTTTCEATMAELEKRMKPRTMTRAESMLMLALSALQSDGTIDRKDMCDALHAAQEEIDRLTARVAELEAKLSDPIYLECCALREKAEQENGRLREVEIAAMSLCAAVAVYQSQRDAFGAASPQAEREWCEVSQANFRLRSALAGKVSPAFDNADDLIASLKKETP